MQLPGPTYFLSLILLLSSAAVLADTTETYGADLTDATPVRIGELLKNPDQYVDKLVKIEGLVDDVCPAKGCWVDIMATQSKEILRFKVRDDVIVFPAEAKGQAVTAEGVLRKHELSKRRAIKHMRHLAEEKGEDFDPASVTGPIDFYQIEGASAVVNFAGE